MIHRCSPVNAMTECLFHPGFRLIRTLSNRASVPTQVSCLQYGQMQVVMGCCTARDYSMLLRPTLEFVQFSLDELVQLKSVNRESFGIGFPVNSPAEFHHLVAIICGHGQRRSYHDSNALPAWQVHAAKARRQPGRESLWKRSGLPCSPCLRNATSLSAERRPDNQANLVQLSYEVLFTFAHRTLCAAAIRLRPAAETVRFGLATLLRQSPLRVGFPTDSPAPRVVRFFDQHPPGCSLAPALLGSPLAAWRCASIENRTPCNLNRGRSARC